MVEEEGGGSRKKGCTIPANAIGLRAIIIERNRVLFPGCELNVKEEIDCRRIHCASRDLTTLQRIFGRLAGHFIGETHFQSRFDDGLSVVKRCVRVYACLVGLPSEGVCGGGRVNASTFAFIIGKTILFSIITPDLG